MDEEKELDIEELTTELEKGEDYPYIKSSRDMAERLVIAGYGNIERAIIDFVRKLKCYFNYFDQQYIDNVMKEILKNA